MLLKLIVIKSPGTLCRIERNRIRILTKITLPPFSVKESTSTYSGLTITTQTPASCVGEFGTLTVQRLLSARWVVIWGSIQGKGSDYSLTHELGPTQIIFCLLH